MSVIVGPWAGSNPIGLTPGRPAPRRPIPNRYRLDKWGTTQLMDCRGCRTPFAPDVTVPRDRLCVTCRGVRDYDNPSLLDLVDERYPPS